MDFWRWPSHTFRGPGSGHPRTRIEGSEVLEGANRLDSMWFLGVIQRLTNRNACVPTSVDAADVQGRDTQSLREAPASWAMVTHRLRTPCCTAEPAALSRGCSLRSGSRFGPVTWSATRAYARIDTLRRDGPEGLSVSAAAAARVFPQSDKPLREVVNSIPQRVIYVTPGVVGTEGPEA